MVSHVSNNEIDLLINITDSDLIICRTHFLILVYVSCVSFLYKIQKNNKCIVSLMLAATCNMYVSVCVQSWKGNSVFIISANVTVKLFCSCLQVLKHALCLRRSGRGVVWCPSTLVFSFPHKHSCARWLYFAVRRLAQCKISSLQLEENRFDKNSPFPYE